MPTLTEWLESQGVGRYATLFAQHEIGLDVLPDLTEHDLEKLGLPLGARKRLFRKRGASPFIAYCVGGVHGFQIFAARERRIAASCVASGIACARAVATMSRSAGSP